MSRGLSARSLSARRPAKAAPEIAQLGRDRGHLRRDARRSSWKTSNRSRHPDRQCGRFASNVQNAASLRFKSTTDGRTALISGRAADWRKQVLNSLQAMSLLTIVGDHRSHPAVRGSDLQHHAVVGPTARAERRPSEKPPRASSIGRAPERKSGKKQVRRSAEGKAHLR